MSDRPLGVNPLLGGLLCPASIAPEANHGRKVAPASVSVYSDFGPPQTRPRSGTDDGAHCWSNS
ncbi:MAG: hypothetical protein CBC48_21805 [bacterium TMED88]|nr:MAG: hypothetical protein CBC48_21805 [bacterium TMED88]